MAHIRKPAGIAVLAIVLVGVCYGAGFWNARHSPSPKEQKLAQNIATHPLLARRVFSENPNDLLLDFVPLRQHLEDYFKNLNLEHSFYFEYLPTGTTIRNGDGQELVGASLLKLPVVMDLYRAAELGMVNLDKTIAIEPDTINSQYGTLYKRGVGAKLTIRQTAEIALSQSDNTAILMIQKQLKSTRFSNNQSSLEAVDADFHVENNTVLINAKSYTSILKCLYYACYDNPTHSQEILNAMSHTDFNDRIAKPIPDGVRVAHKIGVDYQVLSESDCGIVYVPKRPYILCVMLGTSEDKAKTIMATISKMVYDEVTTL